MAFEIEHKYLVRDKSYRDMCVCSIEMAQGYLLRDPARTVRVRIAGDTAYITVKGKTVGDTRPEFEYEIPVADAREMLSLCDGRVICKTRYYVDFSGYRWEVDEFHGELDSLVLAEIELPESTHDYPLPPFVGQDVTGDPRYYNSNL